MAEIAKPASRKIVDEKGELTLDWKAHLGKIADAVSGPFPVRTFSKDSLPDAGKFPLHLIHVNDATGGACLAFSDGTDWQKITIGTTVS